MQFIEPGSGNLMETGKWYILSDSGAAYTDVGYNTAEEAAGSSPYGYTKEEINICDPLLHLEDMGEICNVVLADTLLAFWLKEDKDIFKEFN